MSSCLMENSAMPRNVYYYYHYYYFYYYCYYYYDEIVRFPRNAPSSAFNLDQHWNCFKGNIGDTPERRGGAHMGLAERIDTFLD